MVGIRRFQIDPRHEAVAEGVYQPVTRGKEPRFVSNNTTDRYLSVVDKDGELWQAKGERLVALAEKREAKLAEPVTTEPAPEER